MFQFGTQAWRGVPPAWHEAGLAHGGSAIEDPPGVRKGAVGKIQLAYLRVERHARNAQHTWNTMWLGCIRRHILARTGMRAAHWHAC